MATVKDFKITKEIDSKKILKDVERILKILYSSFFSFRSSICKYLITVLSELYGIERLSIADICSF